MKQILVIGAGRSTGQLITYLQANASQYDWYVTIADYQLELAEKKANGLTRFTAKQIDIRKDEQLSALIASHDIVVSMVPASMHYPIAKNCVDLGKSLVTASYVSSEIESLSETAQKNGSLIIMEMGLDPGIDHMSAKQEIDEIHEKGGEVTSFKSFTGGLVAPESDDNPWNYKITWNPRNVVLAGQGAVKFIRNGKYKYIPYHNLFKRLETITVDGLGEFEGYANRDSLKYRKLYNLENIPTILRGTLRRKGFCEAWDVFVQLGITDDSYIIENLDDVTYRDFINAYLAYHQSDSVESKIAKFFKLTADSPILKKLEWLGLFSTEIIPLKSGSPAQVLQTLLEKKWKLNSNDKDMIVMQHIFEYTLSNSSFKRVSTLVIKGDDAENTSMAKTVGLPLGVAVKNILKGNWKELKGLCVPTEKLIYQDVMTELAEHQVKFDTKEFTV